MGSIPTRSRHLSAAAAVLWLVLPFAPVPLPGQDAPPVDPPTPPAGQEAPPAAGDTARRGVPSPLGALGRSLLLPGWGQAATGRPGRGAVYFAAEAASVFMVFKTQSKLDAARRAVPADSSLIDARVAQREDWIVLAAFFALMSGVDAWVAAHLADFEGEVRPPPDGGPGVEVVWRLAVGGSRRP